MYSTATPASNALRTQLRYIAVSMFAFCGVGCTLHVDSFVDAPDANPGDGICARAVPARGIGLCTLRAAIEEANASAFVQRIEIPAGTYSLTLPYAAGGGPLVIADSVAIRGAGASATIIDAAAYEYQPGGECVLPGQQRRVFTIEGGTVDIRYLTLRGGNSQHGGAVRVDDGTVEISDAVIYRNGAFTGGGGVLANGGTTRIRRTSITENCTVGAFGGGMLIMDGADVWVYDSLIANNRSNRAGGIHNQGNLNLRSSTISGNLADSPTAGTGGLLQNGFAVLNNVTITNNTGRGQNTSSFLGGGLRTSAGKLSVVRNSIIAGNDGQGGPNDCSGELTADSRYNLIGDSEGCEIPSNLQTFLLDVDPLLSSLASHGGPTQTHRPFIGSPAVEAAYEFPPPASDACETHDQRGVPRPQGSGRCDMGAVETGNAGAFVTSFVLVDADADVDLFTLRNGEVLNLAALPPNLSVRVTVSPSPDSVVFGFDATANFQIENTAPYALGGDGPVGDYIPVLLEPGEHTIRATPFSEVNATGSAGGSLEVRFVVIGESPGTS